jgi:ankyrin repeat protein
MTALHIAVRDRKEEIVRMLLDRGACVSTQNTLDHMSPVHYAAQADNLNILEMLTANAVEANTAAGDADGNFPIHYAAMYGNIDVFKFLHDTIHFPVVQSNARGRMPLHIAAMYGNGVIVEYLLSNFLLPVNGGTSIDGLTPLHFQYVIGDALFQNF